MGKYGAFSCFGCIGFILTAAFVPGFLDAFSLQRRSLSAATVHRAGGSLLLLSAEASPYFSIESSPTGPGDNHVHTLTFHKLPHQDDDVPPITIQTGKIGRQAAGAVTVTRGDSVVYATAARDSDPKEEIDFCPLSVDYQERFSSAGMTSGAFNKRDGRPAEHEILTCRLIDRPIRPLIMSGWRHETQLLSWVLSYDGVRSCDTLAIVGAASSLYISDVPLTKPVAAVQVGMRKDGTFIMNPNNEEAEESPLNLMLAGTEDAVLMIEGAADFLPESSFIEAIKFGQDAITVLCQGMKAFGETVGVEKYLETIKKPPANVQERVDQVMTQQVDDMYSCKNEGKVAKGALMTACYKDVVEKLIEEFPGEEIAIKGAFKKLLSSRMYTRAKQEGLRCDNRELTEIRKLFIETSILPRVHGSALFTRGETQTIATTTLGDSGMRQKIDKIDGLTEKRFYLQYTFPPSCVGETGRVGAPGRREVGHGNLAERALIPTLPSEKEFPYSIRLESLITESHGSSSMASVCGGCLSLMDAGVPIKRPVAGIAMGMLLDQKDSVSDEGIILSDISGTEDALGMMDFKVAGDREGITTFQLDIKCEGLTLTTMEKALEQARVGRIHLLDEMEKVLPQTRDELPTTVPKMLTFSVSPDSIGKIIGPGGKQIRAIIEDFALAGMDVNDDGQVQVSSFDAAKLNEAQEFVLKLVAGGGKGGPGGGRKDRVEYQGPQPVEGETYTGKITGIHQFGVFVEILPGAEDGSYPGLEGLVHVSELARDRVRNCEAFIKSMGAEILTVKYIGLSKGKIQLSRKAVLEEAYNQNKAAETVSAAPNGATTEMDANELDIISQAIEQVSEL
jgi:polyribonucleotide nucleotidyltransferase